MYGSAPPGFEKVGGAYVNFQNNEFLLEFYIKKLNLGEKEGNTSYHLVWAYVIILCSAWLESNVR